MKVSFFILLCKARCLESSFAVRGAELNFYSSVWSPESCKQGARSPAHLIMRLSAFLPRRTSCRYRLLRCKVWDEPQRPNLPVITNQTYVNTHTHTHKRRVFTHAAIAASSLTLSSCALHCHSGWHLWKKKPNKNIKTKLKQDCVHLQLGPRLDVPKHSRMLCQQPVSQLSTKHILRHLKPKQHRRLSQKPGVNGRWRVISDWKCGTYNNSKLRAGGWEGWGGWEGVGRGGRGRVGGLGNVKL